MSASLSTTSGVILNAQIGAYPTQYQDPGQPDRTYFSIQAFFFGTYDTLPVEFPGFSQNFNGTHHGVSISEWGNMSGYREWLPGDTTATGPVWDNSSVGMSISPFTVQGAYANFQDFSWDWGNGDTFNGFQYSINWNGYTDNPVAAAMYSSSPAVNVGSVTATPEPATMAFLAIGGLTFAARMRRRQVA